MTYSDSFNLRTTSVKFNDVADAIDGTLTRIYVASTTGTSTAYVASPTPVWKNYTDAPILVVVPHTTNAAGSPSVTINVSGLGTKAIKRAGSNIAAGTLVSGTPTILVFNSTGDYFEVLILENAIKQDGTIAPIANLPMGGFKHTNAAAASASGEYLTYGQVTDGSPLGIDYTNKRVGIGTTSPTTAVSMDGTTEDATIITNSRYSADTGAPGIVFRKSRATSIGTNTAVTTGDNLGKIDFLGSDGTSFRTAARIIVNSPTTTSTGIVQGRMTLSTANASGVLEERLRIEDRLILSRIDTLADGESQVIRVESLNSGSGRNAQIAVYKHSGITNPCAYLYLAREDAGLSYYWTDNSGNLRVSSSSSNIGTTGGTVVGTQTSDERIKTVSGPISYGLSVVSALEPVNYVLKDDVEATPRVGFLAQQVRPLVPEAVYDTGETLEGFDPNETKLAMDYSALIPVLVKAVQELSNKVEALEARVAALEGAA